MLIGIRRQIKASYPNFCTKRVGCIPARERTPYSCGSTPAYLKPAKPSYKALLSCLYPHFDAFLARGCGRQNRAWGGASAEPQVYGVSTHQARGAGGSFLSCDISSSLRLGQWLSPTSRACAINPDRTWGSATLHPRLYSAARIRGLRYNNGPQATRLSSG